MGVCAGYGDEEWGESYAELVRLLIIFVFGWGKIER